MGVALPDIELPDMPDVKVEVELPGVPSLPNLPKVPDVGLPSASFWLRVSLYLSIVISFIDISTSLAMAIHFSTISLSGYRFVVSTVILSLSPHALSLYEWASPTAAHPFWLGKLLLNQLHLSSAYISYRRVTCSAAEEEAVRVRSLQTKMINSIAVGIPQAVVQCIYALQQGPSTLFVLSAVSASLTIAEAMAEFSLREGDGVMKRWLHICFFIVYQLPLLGGYAYLASQCGSKVLLLLVPLGVVLFNFLSLHVVLRFYPNFTSSARPLTLATDSLTYLVGFADINLTHAVPDTVYLVKGAAEAYIYTLLPVWAGCEGAVHPAMLYTVAGCHGVGSLIFVWVRLLKQSKACD
eukprot:TRINITY_DN22862_c0_g2_i1.p1 TRINITY_DN22862_c0_g2~~TRINITY_DN22862_c0_g2_i1.p1  ORF type:complete len:406 (+),score=122.36 TRINITY_DN22862_c0_g2_i1:162-1220(+)